MGLNGLITLNTDGKPLEKLIQVVSDGIGTIYRPRKIRKEADAQAYAIKVLERAKAEASAEAALIEAETANRISQRIVAKEIRRQENIDIVVEMTANNLEGKEVSDEPVEKDWAYRFFDIVQDVSKEEMRVLWAKILAKEIERPSSYSLRTLELLRYLSYDEAQLFVKLSEFVFVQEKYCFVFNDNEALSKYGLNYLDLSKLREAGLLQTGEMVTKTFSSSRTGTCTYDMVCGNKIIELTLSPATSDIVLPINLLSQAGCELYELIEPKDNPGYLKAFSAYIKRANPTASVKYGKILERDGIQIRYQPPLEEL